MFLMRSDIYDPIDGIFVTLDVTILVVKFSAKYGTLT